VHEWQVSSSLRLVDRQSFSECVGAMLLRARLKYSTWETLAEPLTITFARNIPSSGNVPKNIQLQPLGNSHKNKDSYVWQLMSLLQKRGSGLLDYAFLDGSHDFTMDGMSFTLLDRLLKVNGYIEFDDYSWSCAYSKAAVGMACPADDYTDEQHSTPHVKLIVDLLVKTAKCYQEIVPDRLYKKICAIEK
jgi:hypothetical protein